MSKLAGATSSSSMISLQRSMHSSQMYTPGPAISFLTCRCDLPQKLHSSCSLESVGRAIVLGLGVPAGGSRADHLVLRDHAVDDSVSGCFLGAHEIVTFGVGLDLVDL